MSETGLEREKSLLKKRDTKKYGNPDGPTYEYAIEKGRIEATENGLAGEEAENFAHEYVIISSQRTDPGYNKLEKIFGVVSENFDPLSLP